jgi:hypothetical protein
VSLDDLFIVNAIFFGLLSSDGLQLVYGRDKFLVGHFIMIVGIDEVIVLTE